MNKKALTVIALALCALLTVLCFAACGSKTDAPAETKAALAGTWNANEAEGCAYTFNEDGTGQWDAGEGMIMNFSYVDNGTSVEITYEGSATAQTWNYVIEGSTLTMTDTDTGTVLTYTQA